MHPSKSSGDHPCGDPPECRVARRDSRTTQPIHRPCRRGEWGAPAQRPSRSESADAARRRAPTRLSGHTPGRRCQPRCSALGRGQSGSALSSANGCRQTDVPRGQADVPPTPGGQEGFTLAAPSSSASGVGDGLSPSARPGKLIRLAVSVACFANVCNWSLVGFFPKR